MNASLLDFETRPAPNVSKVRRVEHPDKTTAAGYITSCTYRDRRGYVSPRDVSASDGAHFFGRVGGYGVSTSILRTLRDFDVGYIFIQERGESDRGADIVYEFTIDQYVNGETITERDGDPQSVVPVVDARSTYPGHSRSLWSWTGRKS